MCHKCRFSHDSAHLLVMTLVHLMEFANCLLRVILYITHNWKSASFPDAVLTAVFVSRKYKLLLNTWGVQFCIHLLVLVSSGDMWWTWSRTFPFAFCGLHSFRKTHNSQHIAAKCISAGILLGSPYHLHSKSWVAFIFGMSLHVYIIVCPITNELLK